MIFHWLAVPQFVYALTLGKTLIFFLVLAIMNKGAINMHAQNFVNFKSTPLGKHQKVPLLFHMFRV